jgi:hypothetical protein
MVSVIANSPRRDPRRARAGRSARPWSRMRHPPCFLWEDRVEEMQGRQSGQSDGWKYLLVNKEKNGNRRKRRALCQPSVDSQQGRAENEKGSSHGWDRTSNRAEDVLGRFPPANRSGACRNLRRWDIRHAALVCRGIVTRAAINGKPRYPALLRQLIVPSLRRAVTARPKAFARNHTATVQTGQTGIVMGAVLRQFP